VILKREDDPKGRGGGRNRRAAQDRSPSGGRPGEGDGGRPRLWSGTVGFGLVTVPVAIVPAILPRRNQFHLIHKTDASRLSRRMYCSEERVPVGLEHMERGFEIEPGRHVVVTQDELDSIAAVRSKTIEIEQFVPSGAIDPAWYETPHYLVPTGPEKPYLLLVETLADLGMVGLSRFVMHAREHLCCLRSLDGVLGLMTLRFADELRPAQDVLEPAEAESAEPDADEVRRIRTAIARATRPFSPREIRDEYQKRVDELIARKKSRHETVEIPVAQREEGEGRGFSVGEGLDLETALEMSLAQERGRR
jgi:DNA end-binding protein Ku